MALLISPGCLFNAAFREIVDDKLDIILVDKSRTVVRLPQIDFMSNLDNEQLIHWRTIPGIIWSELKSHQ